jgi:hypothetical protein
VAVALATKELQPFTSKKWEYCTAEKGIYVLSIKNRDGW